MGDLIERGIVKQAQDDARDTDETSRKGNIIRTDGYDPNIYMTSQVVRITLTCLRYTGHIAFQIKGNCRGASILEFGLAVDDWPSKIVENDCGLSFIDDDEVGEVWRMQLKNPEGETLDIEEYEAKDVEDMITAVEIIEQNEYRMGG